jgi:hypothetical protein
MVLTSMFTNFCAMSPHENGIGDLRSLSFRD